MVLNIFKKKQSVLEEMAADEVEEQPSLVPDKPTLAPLPADSLPIVNTESIPMPTCKPPKEEKKVCPDCGTTDCISLKEYQKRIKVGNGGFSISAVELLQCCNARQQMNKAREIKLTGSTGPK
jgi:hypothetical protein